MLGRRRALEFISGHYETGASLPTEMLEKMLAAKNFQSAIFILRQLEFGLFDFTLHTEFDPENRPASSRNVGPSEEQSSSITKP